MKAIVCEMCGSHDLIKKDGVFVCEHCGCKYTVEEARKLMLDDPVTVKIDNSNQLETFKNMAINAYESGNTEEAYQYFLKVIEIDPTDYVSIFYKGMCQGWQTSLARERVGEAVSAYHQAMQFVPDELSESISEMYLTELINLISSWLDLARNRYYEEEEWYSYNVSIFWDYMSVCGKILDYMEGFKQTVLETKSESFIKQFGRVYCDACYGMCTYIIEWTDFTQEQCTFPGASLQSKRIFLEKYDDMVFEVRKYDSDFERTDKLGYFGKIDRVEKPTRMGLYNTNREKNNVKECIKADEEIDRRVEKWKEEQQTQLEKEYWDAHPADKAKYEGYRAKYDECKKTNDIAKSQLESVEKEISKKEIKIRELNEKILLLEKRIVKLQNKIFGKAKAETDAEKIRQEITEYHNTVLEIENTLNEDNKKKQEAEDSYNKAKTEMINAKREYEEFLGDLDFM